MSTADIYSQINTLRHDAITKAHTAGQLNPDYTLDQYLAAAGTLTEDDWTEDDTYGRTLGNPETDWSVDIVGDTVRVFAGGDIEAEAVIDDAGSL